MPTPVQVELSTHSRRNSRWYSWSAWVAFLRATIASQPADASEMPLKSPEVPAAANNVTHEGLFRTDTNLSAINTESGVFEDMRQGLDLGLTRLFNGCRMLSRRILLIPSTPTAQIRRPRDAVRSFRARRASISLARLLRILTLAVC